MSTQSTGTQTRKTEKQINSLQNSLCVLECWWMGWLGLPGTRAKKWELGLKKLKAEWATNCTSRRKVSLTLRRQWKKVWMRSARSPERGKLHKRIKSWSRAKLVENLMWHSGRVLPWGTGCERAPGEESTEARIRKTQAGGGVIIKEEEWVWRGRKTEE